MTKPEVTANGEPKDEITAGLLPDGDRSGVARNHVSGIFDYFKNETVPSLSIEDIKTIAARGRAGGFFRQAARLS